MSDLPPKADIAPGELDVRFVRLTDSCTATKYEPLRRRTTPLGSSPSGIPMSAPGEEVSCHAEVIRGAEGTIGERNRSRLSRLEDRKSCVRMKLMNHLVD
jgi:hypothetical protein